MPKKSFSFDVTGRKLFAAERVAVTAFMLKYPTGSESPVVPLRPTAQRVAKEQAGQVVPLAGDAETIAAPKRTNRVKLKKRMQKKKASSLGPMQVAVIKGLIFGVSTVAGVKPAATTKRTTATTGATAPSKSVSTKRGASRTARVV